MIDSRSPRLRRGLAVSLLVMSAGLLLSLTILPAINWMRSELDERQLMVKELSKLQGLVDSEPELRALHGKIDGHPLWQRIYRGDSSGTADSELQQDFRAMAEKQGITVDTIQPLNSVSLNGFTQLSLRVGFNTTIDHLGMLLLAIEAAPRLMRFENLYVTAPMSQNAGSNAPLVIRGDLISYLLAEHVQ